MNREGVEVKAGRHTVWLNLCVATYEVAQYSVSAFLHGVDSVKSRRCHPQLPSTASSNSRLHRLWYTDSCMRKRNTVLICELLSHTTVQCTAAGAHYHPKLTSGISHHQREPL